MKKFVLLLPVISLALVACERKESHNPNSPDRRADNTELNVRDRDARAQTSFDQGENENDRVITQQIRRAVISENVSTNAKNIKIITRNGIVILRGPVAGQNEVDIILRITRQTPGVKNVDNQLDVARNGYNY